MPVSSGRTAPAAQSRRCFHYPLCIKWSVIGACPEIGTLGIGGSKRIPHRRSEDPLLGNVMHVNRNPQHGSEGYQVGSDVAVTYRTMVRSPIVHDRINVGKCPAVCKPRYKPGGGPGWIRTVGELDADSAGKSTVCPSASCNAGPRPLT